MAKVRLLSEFLRFLRQEKKWWLIPLLIVLAAAVLFILAFESPLSPFLYLF